MTISLDISNKNFGELTALFPVSLPGKARLWLCSCSCGSSTLTSVTKLSSGHSTTCGCSRRYNLDHFFFSRETILSSYWAGFIAADGNISSRNSVTIGLARRDIEHLGKFKEDISFSGPIREFNSRCNNILFPSCSISFSSERVVRDLSTRFSITERKSLTLKPPYISREECVLSFIIGYIDGDGSIWLQDGRPILSIIGTRDVVGWANDWLCYWVPPPIRSTARLTNNGVTEIRISSGRLLSLWEIIQAYGLPYMKRKWESLLPTN